LPGQHATRGPRADPRPLSVLPVARPPELRGPARARPRAKPRSSTRARRPWGRPSS
jgi:hypothetical protein